MEQLAFSHHPSDFTHRPQPWKISTLNFLSTTSFVKSKNSSCHCLSPNTHLWTVPANSSQKAPRLPGDTWTFLWGANLNKTRLFSKKPNKSLPKTCVEQVSGISSHIFNYQPLSNLHDTLSFASHLYRSQALKIHFLPAIYFSTRLTSWTEE